MKKIKANPSKNVLRKSTSFLVEVAISAPQASHLITDETLERWTQKCSIRPGFAYSADEQIYIVDRFVDSSHLIHVLSEKLFY